MPNKSISFNEEMIRAILDGRKTQTRRPHTEAKYQVGDVLFVAEPWKIIGWNEDLEYYQSEYQADNKKSFMEIPYEINENGEIDEVFISETFHDMEAAGYKLNEDAGEWDCPKDKNPTRIRLEMPEYASRIRLKITSIRKEKLQDITEQDARKGGLIMLPASCRFVINHGDQYFGGAFHDYAECFAFLWDSIYGNDKSKCWNTNPWVFVGDEFEDADTPAFKKYLKDYKKWEKKHPLFDGYSTPGHDHKYSIKEFEVLNEN